MVTETGIGSGARLLANELILRAIVEVMMASDPSAREKVFDRVEERLAALKLDDAGQAAFVEGVRDAVKGIVQTATA